MTATEFIQQHGDPTTWTVADHETYDNLRCNDAHLDQNLQDSIDRLRYLLAPTTAPRRLMTRRRPPRTAPLARYGFPTLALLALTTNQTIPALICAALTAYAWKGHRPR